MTNRICKECKGKKWVFFQNADGEYDCEPCLCVAYKEMTTEENCTMCGDTGIICIEKYYDENGDVDWEEPVFCDCNQKPWMKDADKKEVVK